MDITVTTTDFEPDVIIEDFNEFLEQDKELSDLLNQVVHYIRRILLLRI
jgi:hypothetical protein